MASSTKSAKQKAAKAKSSKAKKNSSKKAAAKKQADKKLASQAVKSTALSSAQVREQAVPTKLNTWQLQEAKSRFSEVVTRAQEGKPQMITKHGKQAVIMLDVAEYYKLIAGEQSALEPFRQGDLWDDAFVELVNTRDQTPVSPFKFDE
ncbi:MAG: type II toxin-antitoxin system Phd/YefM family antitoxin [Deinococcota bacterium]